MLRTVGLARVVADELPMPNGERLHADLARRCAVQEDVGVVGVGPSAWISAGLRVRLAS